MSLLIQEAEVVQDRGLFLVHSYSRIAGLGRRLLKVTVDAEVGAVVEITGPVVQGASFLFVQVCLFPFL